MEPYSHPVNLTVLLTRLEPHVEPMSPWGADTTSLWFPQVAAKPGVLELLQIDNLLRQLERQEGFMNKIQKALGEYLKRQRAAFSRFYFVGDEDLLEIIGNASEPAKVKSCSSSDRVHGHQLTLYSSLSLSHMQVTQHLSKMFASLASVHLKMIPDAAPEASVVIPHMISKEGEEVSL